MHQHCNFLMQKKFSHVEGPMAKGTWKGCSVNKNSTVVTGQQHTLYADQKVLESRKADSVALNTKSICYWCLLHSKDICVSEETQIKFLSLVDAVGPAREETEI